VFLVLIVLLMLASLPEDSSDSLSMSAGSRPCSFRLTESRTWLAKSPSFTMKRYFRGSSWLKIVVPLMHVKT